MIIENQLDKLMHNMETGITGTPPTHNGRQTSNAVADAVAGDDSADPKQEQLLLEQLQAIDDGTACTTRQSWPRRLLAAWKSLPFKAAMGHIGLLFSLSMYCALGGLVSGQFGRACVRVRINNSQIHPDRLVYHRT